MCVILDGTENSVSEPELIGDKQPETGASSSIPDDGTSKDPTGDQSETNPNETGWLFFISCHIRVLELKVKYSYSVHEYVHA